MAGALQLQQPSLLFESAHTTGRIFLASVPSPSRYVLHFCIELETTQKSFVYGKVDTLYNVTETLYRSPLGATCAGLQAD